MIRSSNIVLADANKAVSEAVVRQLTASGHDVKPVSDASSAIEQLSGGDNDLIIVDFDLPDILGLDLLREIKTNPSFNPVRVLMTSTRGREDAVRALESGADDYISKPYSISELQARVMTALSRPAIRPMALAPLAGGIQIDDVRHLVLVKGEPVGMSPLEYNLLKFFINNADRMFSRRELLQRVWNNAKSVNERTVDVNVRRLRSRLAPYKCEHYIQTVRGCGYRFAALESHVGRVSVEVQ